MVWRAVHSVILGIVAPGVLDYGLFQKLHNSLVVFCFNLNFQGVNRTIGAIRCSYLYSSIGSKVAPKFAQVLTIVVMDNQHGVVHILLHRVYKVGKHKVKGILQAPYTAKEGELPVVSLKANQRDPRPIQCTGLFGLWINHGNIGAGGCIVVNLKRAIFPDKALNTAGVENFNFFNNALVAFFVIFVNGEKVHGTIKISVCGIAPKRQHLVRREHSKRECAIVCIIREYPRLAARQCLFGHNTQCALRLMPKHF